MMRIQEIIQKILMLSLPKKLFIILFVIAVGWFAYIKTKGTGQTQVQYQTAQVEKGTLVVSTSASGQISNANSGSISTQASGVITKVYVQNGQQVKQGDPIAEIELDQTAKQNYAQASSSYQSAKNSLDTAQTNYYALQADLFSKNKTFTDLASNSFYTNGDGSPNTEHRQLADFIIAQDNWLSAEAKYKSQQNVISQTQTALYAASLSLSQSSPVIYAPISGIVTGLTLQQGSVLTSQTNSTGTITSQKIASIKTNAPPTLTINITEVDVPKLKIGNKATVTLDAFPEKTYTGQIISIDTVGSVESGVTTYPTTIKFDTEVPEIYSNMSAQANIITNSKADILLVPSSAVQSQNESTFVRIFNNGKITEKTVATGLSSDSQTEIISGLNEGDTIVTSMITSTSGTGSTSQTQSPFSAFGGSGRSGFGVSGGAATNVRMMR